MKVVLKKLILGLVVGFLFVSCSGDGQTPSDQNAFNPLSARLGCPEGYSISWNVDYDGVNFRTRKSNCMTNFGLFCLKNKTTYWDCVNENGDHVPMVELSETLQERTTHVVGIVKENNNKMEIHFPRELNRYSPNGDLDFTELDVEDDYPLDEENNFFIEKGIYQVRVLADRFVVTVNLKK